MRQRALWLLLTLLLAIALPPNLVAAQGSLITLDFESGADQAPIGSTIPGVVFSTSSGAGWLYGDVRTGNYNAPYPQSCPSFGGVCAYAVSGNLFAWMGESSGEGRIDFVDSTATVFSAGFSTADPLTVTAYDAAGATIATGGVAPNLRTGRLDRVELRAPAGVSMAYIVISGGTNRWLMDDLTTDARINPPPPPAEERPSRAALVTIVQRPAPNLTVAPDGVLTLVIEAVNRGRGAAKGATIILPVNASLLTVLDARFSREGAWVSRLSPDAVEIRTGPLAANGDRLTITLRLRVAAGAPLGAALSARMSFTWADGVSGGQGRSNLIALAVAERDLSADALPLAVAAAGDEVSYSAAVFAPLEPVGVWYEGPGGAAVGVATLRADADGQLSASLDTAGLAAGGYRLVLQGHWTQISAAGAFVVGGSGGGS